MPNENINMENGWDVPSGETDNAPFIGGVNVPTQATFVIAAGAANISEITITIKDGHGEIITSSNGPLNVWRSDDATGIGLASAGASGTVIVKPGGFGSTFGVGVGGQSVALLARSDGNVVLEITDTNKATIFVAVQSSFGGPVLVTRQLVGGDYG